MQGLALAGGQRVVGGIDADQGSWPDTAAVFFSEEQGCTGVLIAPTVVLSAGHCAGGITHVVLDTVDYQSGGEEIDVVETIVYPRWERTLDLSLLILEHPASVPPRTIALGCAAEHIEDGAEVVIVGYGATDAWGERYGSRLQQASTEVEDADCSDTWLGCMPEVSPGGELRAGGDGVDACFGDSGGPLYLVVTSQQSEDSSQRMDYNLAVEVTEAVYLVGITSRGYDSSRRPCSEGGIYVRPDAAIDWIEEQTGVDLELPDCGSDLRPSGSELYPVAGCAQAWPRNAGAGLALVAGGLVLGMLGRRRRSVTSIMLARQPPRRANAPAPDETGSPR